MGHQKTNLIDVAALTPEQIKVVLQRLEAEKRKRFEARVAAGEIAVVSVMILEQISLG
jgi:hypothetical protein